jgi:hypothetical protein
LKNLILLFCILINTISFAQTTIKGTVTADGMPLQMANIVLKNTKNQPSLLQTVLIILMVFQWETMKLPLPIPVLNPKLNASQLQTPLNYLRL